MTTNEPLDNPIWSALTGPQASLGAATTLAAVYAPDIAPFAGLAEPSDAAFADLAGLAGGRPVAMLSLLPLAPPPNWSVLQAEPLEQHVCPQIVGPFDGLDAIVDLAPADVPAMLALTEETKPGPFGPATIRMGRYIGVRAADGALGAMAGQRMRLPGSVEISAVCTAPAFRGRGLAGRLMQILAADILAEGSMPFLHVRPANASALRLYQALGFRHRRTLQLSIVQPPPG